jgi:hypothetical protein
VDKPWQEILSNLRAQQAPNQGFLAVLYPRKADQPAPTCTPLADGKGVKVVTTRGTDWIFLSQQPVKWNGEGLSFSLRERRRLRQLAQLDHGSLRERSERAHNPQIQ